MPFRCTALFGFAEKTFRKVKIYTAGGEKAFFFGKSNGNGVRKAAEMPFLQVKGEFLCGIKL